MWRRLVSATMVTALLATSACSYAAWPSRSAGAPPGLTPRWERCNTSKLAPHLDTAGAVYGGFLLVGGGVLFVAALARDDDGDAMFPGRDALLVSSALYAGGGWLVMHLFGRARRHGYRMAEQCVYRGSAAAPAPPRP